VRLWDPAAPDPTTPSVLEGHSGAVLALAALDTPDGPRLASGGDDGIVRLWDPAAPDPTTPSVLEGHSGAVLALAALDTPDGPRLASGGTDGRIGLTPLTWTTSGAIRIDEDDDDVEAEASASQAPSTTYREQTSVLSDLATADDRLDRDLLARDLNTRLRLHLRRQANRDPFAVQVQGPWGSGKTSLVRMLAQARTSDVGASQPDAGQDASEERATAGEGDLRTDAPDPEPELPWLVITYDAWKEGSIGPVWWSMARTTREGISEHRSLGFRLVFPIIDATTRAVRTRAWLTLALVVAVIAAVLFWDPGLETATNWLPLLGLVPLLIAANKFLFWNSAAGARLHARTDNNPLGDVSKHIAWLRRWSPREPLPGGWALVTRLSLVAAGLLLARSVWSPGPPWDWLGVIAVTGLVVVLGPHELLRRYRSSPSDGPVLPAALVTTASLLAVIAAVGPLPDATARAVWPVLFVVLLPLAFALAVSWLGQPKRPVLFVIDDVDRCTADTTVEVLETVQTLMRESAEPRWGWRKPADLVFLVLADGRWLQTAFEQRYAPFADTVGEPGHPLGYLFLDKLVQLTVTIPSVPTVTFRRFVEELLDGELGEARAGHRGLAGARRVTADEGRSDDASVPAQPARGGIPVDPTSAFDDFSAVDDDWSDDDMQSKVALLKGRVAKSASAEAVYDPEIQRLREELPAAAQLEVKRAQVDQSFKVEEAEARHLLSDYVDLLPRNPRTVKRFINAFGVNRTIAYNLLGNSASVESSDLLARWTLLTLRWPELGEALRRDPQRIDDRHRTHELQRRRSPRGEPDRIADLLADPAVQEVIGGTHDRRPRLTGDDIRRFTGALDDATTVPVGADSAGPS
jgi:hypothetical protein